MSSTFPTIDDLIADRKAEREKVKTLRAALIGMVESQKECIGAFDAAYAATGYVRIATTSEQRLRILAASEAAKDVLEQTK